MTTRNETFNGMREFPIAGAYFVLLSTVNPVDIKFFDEAGAVLCDEKQVVAGQWVDRRGNDAYGRPLKRFVRFEITTGANEAVKFAATDGTTGSNVAPANVISTVIPLGLAHVQAKKTVTNASGALLAANATRRYLYVQNQDPSGDVYIRTDGGGAAVADAGSVRLRPGDVWEPAVPPLAALTAIGSIASNANVQVTEA